MYLGVIVNPQARKNRGATPERITRIVRAVGVHGEVCVTRSLEELEQAVERLLPRVTHLVSDGGDGALHWLINEVSQREANADAWPAFVPTNGGTIDFVARKAGIRGRTEGLITELARAAESNGEVGTASLDTIQLRGVGADGSSFERLGFALAAGGVGNRFFDEYYADAAPRPATIVKVIGRAVAGLALSPLLPDGASRGGTARRIFEPTRAKVTIDGETLPCLDHAGIHAGAFDVNLGGVLRVFPQARTPGRLHFQAGQISPAGMVANLPALALGGAVRGPQLRDTAGERMEIEALEEPLAPIVDGEKYRDLLRLTVTPGPTVTISRLRARPAARRS